MKVPTSYEENAYDETKSRLGNGIRSLNHEWTGGRDRLLWPLNGQQESERASFTFFALRPDAATMQFDHSLGNGQPQTHAAETTREVSFDLKESLKYARQVFGGDANTIIHHRHFHMIGDFLNADCHMPARIRELDRVLDQIAQGDTDLYTIRIQVQWGTANICFKGNV